MGTAQQFYFHLANFKHVKISGPVNISAIYSMVPEDVKTGWKDHQEDNHDAKKDEGDGTEGNILQVTTC